MKILVPTDFSKCSENALNASILLAKKLDAEIHLLHCVDLPRIWNITPKHRELIEKYEEMLKDQAQSKLEGYKSLLIDHNIPCEVTVVKRDYKETIVDNKLFKNIDLVMIGSHGDKGKHEWFIGSNTQKILRKIDSNVIVVKEEVQDLEFKKVLYVTGLSKNEQDDFKIFLEFISDFPVEELHILSIDTLAYFSQPSLVMREALKDFRSLALDFNVKTHFFKDFSVDAGVRHFVEENDIDFIGISNSYKHPIKRIFNGSNVEMIINHSDVPVMAIDNK